MLEFIVLGHIPGTDIYLSFETVALVAGSFCLAFTVYKSVTFGWRTQLKKFQEKQATIAAHTM